jgi:phosphatidylserine decarboxylase
MEIPGPAAVALSGALVVAAAYLFWRYVWFWRNPARTPPVQEGLLAAADGTVVYVKKFTEADEVISIKRGLAARLIDITRDDATLPKLLIGVFMSPFDVHYNRAPLSGMVEFVRHHAGRGRNVNMGPMHRRVLARRRPYYRGSEHLVQNERTVTKINGTLKGAPASCYVVQIAAKTVAGIDSYVRTGDDVTRGAIFGMIRIGSQVDIVVPWRDDLRVHVRPGDRVRAGETLLID